MSPSLYSPFQVLPSASACAPAVLQLFVLPVLQLFSHLPAPVLQLVATQQCAQCQPFQPVAGCSAQFPGIATDHKRYRASLLPLVQTMATECAYIVKK
jgi:hypothetical protein